MDCPHSVKNIDDLKEEGLKDLFVKGKLYKAKLEIRNFTRDIITKEIHIEPKDVEALIALFEIMDKTKNLSITIHKTT